MPRPTSKTDLLNAIDTEYAALCDELAARSPEKLTEPGIVGEWSVKDVMAHLLEWIQMCMGWHQAGLMGETPQIPAPGYKWNQTPALNQHIYEKNRERTLDDIQAEFHRSAQEILDLIRNLSNEQLFSAGQYAWTKKNTLGAYMVSATSSHYLWARKEIRKGFRAKEKAR